MSGCRIGQTIMRHKHFFRFYIAESTWQYTISIQACNFTHLSSSENTTSSNETDSIPQCPLIVAVRSSGLAATDGSDGSHRKDCSLVSRRCYSHKYCQAECTKSSAVKLTMSQPFLESQDLNVMCEFMLYFLCFQLAAGIECVLTVQSPTAEDWQHVVLEPTHNHVRVNFTFTVSTKCTIESTTQLSLKLESIST